MTRKKFNSPQMYIILLFLCINYVNAVSICNQCICSEETSVENQFPIGIVDCKGRELETLPDTADSKSFPLDTNYLDVSYNNIKELNQYNYEFALGNLLILDISHNIIEEIDDNFFNYVTSLEELNLSYNKIASLNTVNDEFVLEKLKNLRKLDLSYNALKTIPSYSFENFPKLQYLDISYNNFTIEFINKPKLISNELGVSRTLTHLFLDNIGLSKLPGNFLDTYDNLTSLSLADNDLEVIPSLPSSLEIVDLSGNHFPSLILHYLRYSKIKHLKLSRLIKLTQIHHYAFHDLTNLECLELTDCVNLQEFTGLAFGAQSKSNHRTIKHLSLARNGLTTLNETYKYIFDEADEVDLRFNPFRCDCGILWLKEYKHILVDPMNVLCVDDRSGNKAIMDLSEEDLPDCHPGRYGKRVHRMVLVLFMVVIILLVGLISYLLKYSYMKPSTSPSSTPGPSSPYSHERLVET